MKTLYFDCFSGISGDMVIGALLDAGGDALHLETELKKLKIEEEYQLKWKKIVKNGITATKFDVKLMNDHHGHYHEHGTTMKMVTTMNMVTSTIITIGRIRIL